LSAKKPRKDSVMGTEPYSLHKVVFTGGPCGGKTTAISSCQETLKDLAHDVICVPEAASLIFSSGGVLNMATYTPDQGIEFQKCLMKLQMSLESIFTRIVRINPPKDTTCIVLCDRGLMDGKAYLSPEQWDVLLNEMGLYECQIKDFRYDLVIHMTTAADGAEEFYNLANNKARDEDAKLAIEMDRKIKKAWKNHPQYLLLSNDVPNFEAKINQAFDYIVSHHGYPIDMDFTIKLLVSNTGMLYKQWVTHWHLEDFKITDLFLDKLSIEIEAPKTPKKDEGTEEKVVYIRKRVAYVHAGT